MSESTNYVVELKPGLLYISELGKVYAKVFVALMFADNEYIPSPTNDDIQVNDEKNDIVIKLRAVASDAPGDGTNADRGTILVELNTAPDPTQIITPEDVLGLVNDPIGVTVKLYSGSVANEDNLKASNTGTIDNNSEIDIE